MTINISATQARFFYSQVILMLWGGSPFRALAENWKYMYGRVCQKKPNPGHEGNISPEARAKQYPGIFYKKLFCRICNVVVYQCVVRESVCEVKLISNQLNTSRWEPVLKLCPGQPKGLANDICLFCSHPYISLEEHVLLIVVDLINIWLNSSSKVK